MEDVRLRATRGVHLQGSFRMGFTRNSAILVLEGILLWCQCAGKCLFVMMRVIQWSLVGMIETIFEQSSYKITKWRR